MKRILQTEIHVVFPAWHYGIAMLVAIFWYAEQIVELVHQISKYPP